MVKCVLHVVGARPTFMNTERPIAITDGTNQLVGSYPDLAPPAVGARLDGLRDGDGRARQGAATAMRSFSS
jgi:hypothetical protein